jgi:hypothetical protein
MPGLANLYARVSAPKPWRVRVRGTVPGFRPARALARAGVPRVEGLERLPLLWVTGAVIEG